MSPDRGDGGEPRQEPQAEIVEVTGEGRPLGPIGQHSNRAIVAAAGLVTILALVAVVAFANRAPVRPIEPSPAAVVPTLKPDPIFPASAGGLPVVAVSSAQTIAADPTGTSTELAVGGWYSAVRLVESCRPSIGPVGSCISDWQAVLESRPDVRWSNDGASHPIEAGTATITPLFIDPVASPALESSNPSGPLEIVPPSPLVLIGHFHDDRLCETLPGPSTLCTSAFVVDAVADLAGTLSSGPSPAQVESTRLTSTAIVDLIRSHLQAAGFVLAYGALPWSVDSSAPPWVEPSAAGSPVDGRTVWLVRGYLDLDAVSGVPGYGAAIPSWMAIDDTSLRVWGPLAGPVAANPLGSEFPKSIDGLPVRTVAEALGTEVGRSPLLAIGGYLSNDRAPEGCPPAPTTDKPNPCSGTQLVLIDQPDPALQPNDATFLYDIVVPVGLASIQPIILPGTKAPDPWAGSSSLEANVGSRPVVLVGQLGDPRSPECAPRPGGGNAGCDRSFVVDQIAWIDGLSQDPSVYLEPGQVARHGFKEVNAAISGWFLPGAQPAIISITGTTTADAAALTGISLAERKPGLVWVVRVVSSLPGGPASGSLVFDDQDLALVAVSP
jgi:hypothetical protein